MKTILLLFGFLSFTISANSQIHWLINQDTTIHCEIIQTGKFINKITDSESTLGYYVIIKDGYATEYVENGKYFVKSKIKFENPCKYESTIVENTIPNYNVKIGDKIYTEIIETALADKLIKIKSKMSGDWQTFVWEKIE